MNIIHLVHCLPHFQNSKIVTGYNVSTPKYDGLLKQAINHVTFLARE